MPAENLVIYGTTQTHSLGAKAALVLGLSFRALEVSKEDNYALRGSTLREAIDRDRASGRHPFIVRQYHPDQRTMHLSLSEFPNSCYGGDYIFRRC